MLACEQRWVRAILGSFAPEGTEGLSPRPGEVDYVAAFAAFLVGAAPLARIGLRLALWLVALSPVFMRRGFTTFLGVAEPERPRLLAELLDHPAYPVREGTFLLKTVACLALFRSDAVRARSRYDGEPRPELVQLGGRP